LGYLVFYLKNGLRAKGCSFAKFGKRIEGSGGFIDEFCNALLD
jgi:hypothetical protein